MAAARTGYQGKGSSEATARFFARWAVEDLADDTTRWLDQVLMDPSFASERQRFKVILDRALASPPGTVPEEVMIRGKLLSET